MDDDDDWRLDDLHALVRGLAANSFSPARVNLEGCIGGAHAALPGFLELLRDNVVAIESLNLGYNRLEGPATGGPRGAALCAALAEALAGIDQSAEGPDVVLRADRALDYGRVMAIMGELNRAGLNRISLVTGRSSDAP